MNQGKSHALRVGGISLAFLVVLLFASYRIRLKLGLPELLTGWSLFVLMMWLTFFNARKRLSMLPLATARNWLILHVVVGLIAVPLFWLHTGVVWPTGLYEQVLALLFYLVSANGLLGFLLLEIYPARLTQTGLEIIYERIPAEIAEMREKAETILLSCTRETGSDTLAKHYLEALDWFFRRPRFFMSHALGGQRGSQWVRHQLATVRRYLDDKERSFLEEIARIAEVKNKVDFHYALQSIMKGWLLVHVPLAVAVIALAGWHVLIVHVYFL